MSHCSIQLENYEGHYYTGSTVTGKVICNLRNTKTIRGIRLCLMGHEHTAWTQGESYYNSQTKNTERGPVHYSGENTFFKNEVPLGYSGDIGPGTFEYPFAIVLPKNLPSTYHGTYGSVKYTIKATVDRDHKLDFEDIKELFVIAVVDFNEISELLQMQPVAYSVDKQLCCCCCSLGTILMTVHLEKEAFVTGETAHIKVDVTNLSATSIESVSVEIGTEIEMKVMFPTTGVKYDYKLIATSKDTGVGAKGERSYSFYIQIPSGTEVLNFSNSILFSQWTKIKVTAVLPSPHRNLKESSTVTLGHVPLGDCVHHLSASVPVQGASNQPPMYTTAPTNVDVSDINSAPGPSYIMPMPSVHGISSESDQPGPSTSFESPTFSSNDEANAPSLPPPPPPSYDEAISSTTK